MSWLSEAAALVNAILGHIPMMNKKYVHDSKLVEQLQQFQKQNADILAKYNELMKRMEDQDIDSSEDLQRFDRKEAYLFN
ncbi:unnamed protein product [Adineta steineri]|uniref:Uncharacterized protein n=1 Tax=Adineta steineri TaxID=433720 RepID=A0A818VDH2_9BILA|nr:unnamed protein product [Adineta steineri]CAF1475778.1 unnamed protein product [Adineta steineri]CAF3709600.1 unnamed protein product [Adineta steineri]CAF4103168.1 unnamed protein product [Adineta steineri]